MRFVVLGNPDSPRVEGFQSALLSCGLPPAKIITWSDFLGGRVQLSDIIQVNNIVRLESPGRDWPVEKLLLQRGAQAAEFENQWAWIPSTSVKDLAFEKGRLWPSRQWFLGLKAALMEVETQLKDSAPHCVTHNAQEIEIMFDKPHCQARLHAAKIPTPRTLDIPQNFDDLTAKMQAAHCRRAFIKLAHGSSAAGVVAYQTNGISHRAVTTSEVVKTKNQTCLYNSRRVRTLTSLQEIAELIDTLCRHRAHAEEWIPKDGFQGRSCDLRVVVIKGRARHKVVRLSRHPLTNLHLLNDRVEGKLLRNNVSPESWEAAMHSCEKVMHCFPNSLCGGVDLLFTAGFARHAIIEVNAWGDLLPGTLHENQTTYEAQIDAAINNHVSS
ncbi:MAG TPA: STM4014 family protein [Abditibacteriaceae bacterium]|jgi:glutathione synthase/RimK-type ligase-like ATP-grasp enzyme